MTWVQDSFQRVLFVRQVTGLKLWTLPGGKVKRGERSADSARALIISAVSSRAFSMIPSHAAVGSHRPLSLRGAAPVRAHRRKDSNLLAMRF
jgi:hypothetical protein